MNLNFVDRTLPEREDQVIFRRVGGSISSSVLGSVYSYGNESGLQSYVLVPMCVILAKG